MRGTIAVTDYGWFDLLRNQQGLEEVNFWKPSATRGFHADQFHRLSLSYELPTTPSVDSVSLRDTQDCLFGWRGNVSALAMGVRASRKCVSGLGGYETGSDTKVRLKQKSVAS